MQNPQLQAEANNPSDCVLALAMPLTREAFLGALAHPDKKDFVFHFRRSRGLERANPEFCWQVYQAEEAIFVSAVCEQVAHHHVKVIHDVDLAKFTTLLAQYPVVTLVAHSRFVKFKADDFKNPFAILDALREPRNKLHQAMREKLVERDPNLLDASCDTFEGLQLRLADVITPIANAAERLYWNEDAQPNSDRDPDLHTRLTRLEFEQAFPDAIVPARVIEFSDGLHTVPAFIKSIPVDFAGVLDLTVCNSVIPAASIRKARARCLVVASRKLVELRSRMYLYGFEIDLLAKEPRHFIDVISEVHSRRNVYHNKGTTLWRLLGRFCGAMQAPR